MKAAAMDSGRIPTGHIAALLVATGAAFVFLGPSGDADEGPSLDDVRFDVHLGYLGPFTFEEAYGLGVEVAVVEGPTGAALEARMVTGAGLEPTFVRTVADDGIHDATTFEYHAGRIPVRVDVRDIHGTPLTTLWYGHCMVSGEGYAPIVPREPLRVIRRLSCADGPHWPTPDAGIDMHLGDKDGDGKGDHLILWLTGGEAPYINNGFGVPPPRVEVEEVRIEVEGSGGSLSNRNGEVYVVEPCSYPSGCRPVFGDPFWDDAWDVGQPLYVQCTDALDHLVTVELRGVEVLRATAPCRQETP